MKALLAGDLHLGRRPSRLPAHVDATACSCAEAWSALVDCAIRHDVELVALSGDLVDRANRYFEAIGPLERGLRDLAAAGITTVAVAGNHDFDVLPELARHLAGDHFHLLGAGGRWERVTIEGRDGGRLHVDGWSFPAEHVRENPLASYALPAPLDAPVLGLLHADLDAAGSAYAPVRRADLRATPAALWLLGHVHAPMLDRAGTPILYPGSPQGMDPGESGAHGAWLVELRPGAPVVPRLVPLAAVRYDAMELGVDDVADEAALREAFVAGVRARARAIVADGGPLRHVSLRVRVTGGTSLHRHVERVLAGAGADLALQEGEATIHVERVTVATRPARDLDTLARGHDAVGELARLLRQLDPHASPAARAATADDGGDAAALARLLDEARATAGRVREARPYQPLAALDARDEAPDDAALRALLADRASLLLDELLAQQEAA